MVKLNYVIFFLFLSLLSAKAQVLNINIPDNNFKRALLLAGIDKNHDNQIQVMEADLVESLDVGFSSITDLTGIEYFTRLKKIDCSGNHLKKMDISKNIALTHLKCNNNELSALDLSKNPALITLECFYNEIATLDLSRNTSLEIVYCLTNKLSSLLTGQNSHLKELNCGTNQLTFLDISKNVALTSLSCYNNQIAGLALGTNALLTELICGNNKLTSLDISANTALTKLGIDGNNSLQKICVTQNQLMLAKEKQWGKNSKVLWSAECNVSR